MTTETEQRAAIPAPSAGTCSGTNDPFRSRRGALLLAGIVGLAIALRLPRFNKSIWFDETWSTSVKLGSLPDLMGIIRGDLHPPLYSVVMFVWIRVFGESEISIRTLPLLCGVLT